MEKGGVIVIVLLLAFLTTVIFVLPKTGFVTSQETVFDGNYLESLRINVGVECLQDSQCSQNYECVSNSCVDKGEINLCKERSLSLPVRRLKIGEPMNSEVGVITNDNLPFLLPNGELVEIVNDKVIEYFYIQTIFIGANKIESQDGNYIIKEENNEPLYIYKLFFSNGVNFSDKNIQGQVLRILGKEYIIGSKSTNSEIELISEDSIIQLSDSKDIKITTNENGDVIKIEILYFSQNDIEVSGNSLDNTFNSIKLSFNYVDKDGFVDVRVGGNC